MASKSLELNDLYKLNPLAQIGLALGVIALILALAYFVLYSGQLDELKAAEAEEVTLKGDYETKAKAAAQLPILKKQLEQIITQKWLAVYPNGNEGWAEVRRTDYPRYLLLPRYGNNSSGEVENTKLIKRVSYPNSESRNPNKPSYTQGTKVWWDVADTMDETGKWKTPDNFR